MPQKYIKRKTKPVATYGETGEENKIQWITKSVGTFTGGGGGETGTVDTEMSDTSTNAVQNKVIKEYVDTADENLSKVMPTDINVDSNGKLILEHDGVEITGQKKLVDFNSKLDKTGGEINGNLDITGEVTTLTGMTILDESSITFKDTKDTTDISFINTIHKDNNSDLLQISGPIQTNGILMAAAGIISQEGAIYTGGGITSEDSLEIFGDVKLGTVGGKTTVYGDAAFDKNVTIKGNLSVSGTTTTVDTETLKVKDNIIVTNSDKKDLIDLSGIAINTGATDTYGIMYNPTSNTVNLGLGKIDENGKFVYNENEGSPLAIRDNSASFTQDHLVSWDANKNALVDGGIDKSNVAQTNKANVFTSEGNRFKGWIVLESQDNTSTLTLIYQEQDSNGDTRLRLAGGSGYVDLDTSKSADVLTNKNIKTINNTYLYDTAQGNISIPVVTASTTEGSTGLSYIKIDDVIYNITDSSKLDKSTSKKMVYVNDADGNPSMVEYSLLPGNSNIAQFDTGGHLYTEYPSIDTHTANKKYVDDVVAGIKAETVKVVEISDVPADATNGTLTDEQLATLQSYDGNYIMFNHEKYYLQDKGHIEGYLTYTHTGYENNQMWLKSITITITTKTWVLNVVGVKPTVVLTQSDYDNLAAKDANTLYYIIG